MNRLSRALVAALLLSAPTPPVALATEATVAELVFAPGFMAAVSEPTIFRYRFRLAGRGMEVPYVSEARMELREIGDDGGKLVWFDMFEGANRRAFGPMRILDQNPMLFVFLQRDVTSMANLTGGAAGYFQQRIRASFTRPAEVETLEVAWRGRELAAERIVLYPFRDDPRIDRFPQFRDKSYEIVVASGLPGGIYRIATRVPDPSGGPPLLEESLTLEAVE